MTDKELLEKAAKAAGYVAEGWCDEEGLWLMDDNPNYGYDYWSSLDNDGDALRLAVKLKLHILHNDVNESVLWVSAVINKSMIHGVVEFASESDREEATRRAITRAAAAMVKE